MLNLRGVLEKCKCVNTACIIGYTDRETITYHEKIIPQPFER